MKCEVSDCHMQSLTPVKMHLQRIQPACNCWLLIEHSVLPVAERRGRKTVLRAGLRLNTKTLAFSSVTIQNSSIKIACFLINEVWNSAELCVSSSVNPVNKFHLGLKKKRKMKNPNILNFCGFSAYRCTLSSSQKELGIIQSWRMLSLTVRRLLRKKVPAWWQPCAALLLHSNWLYPLSVWNSWLRFGVWPAATLQATTGLSNQWNVCKVLWINLPSLASHVPKFRNLWNVKKNWIFFGDTSSKF